MSGASKNGNVPALNSEVEERCCGTQRLRQS